MASCNKQFLAPMSVELPWRKPKTNKTTKPPPLEPLQKTGHHIPKKRQPSKVSKRVSQCNIWSILLVLLNSRGKGLTPWISWSQGLAAGPLLQRYLEQSWAHSSKVQMPSEWIQTVEITSEKIIFYGTSEHIACVSYSEWTNASAQILLALFSYWLTGTKNQITVKAEIATWKNRYNAGSRH